jgi:ribulose-5-phosphate 4-epimerase/fuculose-1-phosphate aldolase
MLTSMGDVMREAYKRGWITTRDGNVSVKINNKFYITPTMVRKYTIQPENIVKTRIVDGKPESTGTPSIEMEMHWLVVNQPGVKSVVHLHPTHCVAAMFAGFDLQKLAAAFPELRRYTKVGPTVPSFEPGSEDLADVTDVCIRGFDIVGQDRHGVTAKARSPWDAFEHIERLEHICQIALASGLRPDQI